MLEYWLKRHTVKSNRAIGRQLGVGKNTVEAKRQELEAGGSIDRLEKLEGEDGKLYPRHAKPRTLKPGLLDAAPLTFPAPAEEAQGEAPGLLEVRKLERVGNGYF